jgi:crossover junction endodeoxyribonuclease RusA
MSQVTITLPYPPSVNHYKSIGRTIRTKKGKSLQMRINSPATKRYFYEVWMKVRQLGLKSFQGATISVEIDSYPPDRRKRDLDGICKVLLDAMQHAGLYDDDYQISCLTVKRMSIIPQGQVIVRIWQNFSEIA